MRASPRLVVVGVALLSACDSPTAPTPRPPATVAAVAPKAVLPIESEFQDSFWRQIAFDSHAASNVTRPLQNTNPNLYIRMGDPTGRRVVAYQLRDHMRRAFPRLVAQITGKVWRGQIRDGIEDWEGPGWITVRFVTEEEEPDRAFEACGAASVGADPGRIWIIRRARGNKNCVGWYFPYVFAHEVGHALGLYHVSDPSSLMFPRELRTHVFTMREEYHGRLLYRVGRGERYCGWPFGAGC